MVRKREVISPYCGLRLQVLRAAAITVAITYAFTVGYMGHLHRASPLRQFISGSKVGQAVFFFPLYTTGHTHSQNATLNALNSFSI